MRINPLNLIDWYKSSHYQQYPEGTLLVFGNFTPRNSRDPRIKKIVFFGLQYFIKHYLMEVWTRNFFEQPLKKVLKSWIRRKDTSLGPNEIGVDHIARLHDLGYLPLSIMGLPEGSRCPIKVPPFVLWNTKPDFFWLPNHLETIISASTWQASTSATIADDYRKIMRDWAHATGDPEFIPFQGHDFSFRGMSSLESACLSGAGHLLSFVGTDSVPAIDFLEQYYNADCEKEVIGVSVPASEHSVASMNIFNSNYSQVEEEWNEESQKWIPIRYF